MALAGAGLAACSVWQVAGRWAAGLCRGAADLRLAGDAAPAALDHAARSGLVLPGSAGGVRGLARAARRTLPWPLLAALVLVIGTIVGVNAARIRWSIMARGAVRAGADRDRLQCRAAIAAARCGRASPRSPSRPSPGRSPRTVMSALSVAPEPGLHTTRLVVGAKTVDNFTSMVEVDRRARQRRRISARPLTPRIGLAFVCAVLSIAAVVSLPWLGWRHCAAPADPRRPRGRARTAPAATGVLRVLVLVGHPAHARVPVQRGPVDIHADRYLVGLLYAAAAVVPRPPPRRPAASAEAAAVACRRNLRVRARGDRVA